MNKYKDSFETRSESLEQGGRGIMTAVANKDFGSQHGTKEISTPRIKQVRNSSSVSPIRTLAGDLEDSVETNHVSISEQALAEKSANGRSSESLRGPEPNLQAKKYRNRVSTRKKGIRPSVLFLFFAIAVFGTSLYFFSLRQGIGISGISFPNLASFFNQESSGDSATTPASSLIQTDETTELVLNQGMGRADLRRILNEESVNARAGQLIAFSIVEEIETPEGAETRPADIASFLDTLDLSIGSVLNRNVSNYTLGVSGRGEARSFLAAEIRSYEEIFGAFLSWERNMPKELYGFFHNDVRSATEGGDASFSDIIVNGSDARVLTVSQRVMNEEGEMVGSEEDLLIYSIVNKEILIITHSREELGRIISRLQ